MSLPTEPYSRIERYLAKLAGQDVDIPDKPITRIECYLDYIVNNGGGVPASNAGAHNATFRGANLGTSFTDAQLESIASGTFDDMFLGDYWEISTRVYRIAGFDLFCKPYITTPFTTHHVVIVPDKGLYLAALDTSGETTAGYAGSTMRTTGLNSARTTISNAFRSYILEVPMQVVSAVTGGRPSAIASITGTIELMTEGQLFGRATFGTQDQNGYNVGNLASQFPLFALAPQYIGSNARFWLQDIVDGTTGVGVIRDGAPATDTVSNQGGVRPFFCVGKVPS